jgi:two-component system chemotaxis response regulator CheB
VLDKPLGAEPDGAWERRLIAAVGTVARISVITHPRKRLRLAARARAAASAPRRLAAPEARVIAIGASTGGPRAVLAVLQSLPKDLPAPVLLVVHIAASFGAAFAEWLDQQSDLKVRCANGGELLDSLPRGTVMIAPPGRHLRVAQRRLELDDGPERHSCRPSVDVLFESVAAEYGAHSAGCLLTGMGKDGAKGLAAMRSAGAYTIAQDEATSVVFGMPGEAVRIGAAAAVLPLTGIAPALQRWISQRMEQPRSAV